MSISPEIQVLFLMGPGLDPAVLPKKERLAVVQHRKSVSSDDPSFQRDFPVCFIQSPGSSFQILEILAVMPDTSVGAEISHCLDR